MASSKVFPSLATVVERFRDMLVINLDCRNDDFSLVLLGLLGLELLLLVVLKLSSLNRCDLFSVGSNNASPLFLPP